MATQVTKDIFVSTSIRPLTTDPQTTRPQELASSETRALGVS